MLLIVFTPKLKVGAKILEKLKKDLDNHFSMHLTDLIVVTRSFLKQMEKQKFGNFIFISSIQGLGAPKFHHYVGTKMNSTEYSIIKAGIINMTKYLKFYKGKNIRFNCISIYETTKPTKKFITNYKKSCLNKGLLDPEDINSTIEYLVSNTSKYVNGQNIIVDDDEYLKSIFAKVILRTQKQFFISYQKSSILFYDYIPSKLVKELLGTRNIPIYLISQIERFTYYLYS